MARTTATLHCAYMYMYNGGGLILRVRGEHTMVNIEYALHSPQPPSKNNIMILKSYQAKVL